MAMISSSSSSSSSSRADPFAPVVFHLDVEVREPRDQVAHVPFTPPGTIKLPSDRNCEVRLIVAPKNKKEVLTILTRAEIAATDGNFSQLEVCDLALKIFYSQPENAISRNFVQESAHPLIAQFPLEFTNVARRIAQLNLPHTKAVLLQQLVNIDSLEITDDLSSHFCQQLEGRLSELMLEKMRERALNQIPLDKEAYVKQFAALAEQLLKESGGEGEGKILRELELNQQFALFLYVLKKPAYQRLVELLFYQLKEAAIENALPEQQCQDLVELARLDPQLISLLGKGSDKIWIRVADKEKNAQVLMEASRLLLGMGSGYFQELVKRASLRDCRPTSDASWELDLSTSHLDKQMLSMLLRWLINSQLLSFSSAKEKGETQLKTLENFLTYFSSFNLYNQAEFLEKIQLEVIDTIGDETLISALKIALRFKLALVKSACLGYIAQHPSQSISLERLPDNSLKVVRTKKTVPLALQQAINLLEKEISSEDFITAVSDSKPGCLKRTVGTVKKIWRFCGGFFERTAICAGVIVGVQSTARIPLWSAGINIGVSSGVGLLYPCISIIFKRCIVPRILARQQRMYVHCCPGIPRMHLRCLERVSTCFKGCLCCTASRPIKEKSLLLPAPEKSPRISKASDFLQKIDLSAASHLTDADLGQLVKQRPHLQQLTLGRNPSLTTLGYAFLAHLKELRELHIDIPNSQSAGSLNDLNLREVFGGINGLKIVLSVSDSTISCFPLTFLRRLPKNAEIHLQLRHEPLPKSSIIFEIRRGASHFAMWPEFISRLVAISPEIRHLDLGLSLVCGRSVLEIISSHYPMLRSLKIQFGDDVNDGTIAGLVGFCPHLEKVHFQCGNFTDSSIEMLVGECRNLSEVTLTFIPNLTNRSLEHLSRATSLRSCKIDRCQIGNDGVNFLLNRKPPLINLEVSHCDGVSDEMLVKLAKCSSATDQPFVKQLASYHRQIKVTPLPLFQMRSLTPMLFQFLIDNLNIESSISTRQRGRVLPPNVTVLEHLGVSKHAKLRLRASSLQALAHCQLNILSLSLWQFKKGFIQQIRGEESYVGAYVLEHILPECLQQTLEAYSVFISKNYPTEYFQQVMKHANTVLEKSKLSLHAHIPRLQLILPWLYSNKNLHLVTVAMTMLTNPESPFKSLVETCAKLTGEEGLKLGWSDEQKCAAFLGVILSHLSWLQGEMITHHRLEIPADEESESKEGEEIEGKEEKKIEGKEEKRNLDGKDEKRNPEGKEEKRGT